MSERETTVPLGDRSYQLVIGRDIRRELAGRLDFLGDGAKVAVVTSPELRRVYGDEAVERLSKAGFQAWVAEIPDGPGHKTLATASLLYDQFVERRMERGSLAIALGGGAIGDVVGFVSATYMRGISYVQMPTTLIAQVDASIGGMVSIDHSKGKNLIGVFYQPKLVLIDVAMLDSLPDRQLRAGIAEILRYAVIAAPHLFETLEIRMEAILSRDPQVLTALIVDSCAIKAHLIGQDETGRGVRATLYYGHTFGHAIEAVTGYGRLSHGEAAAIGMVCAAEMARERGMIGSEFCDRQRGILQAAGLATSCPGDVDAGEIVDAMALDENVVGGRIRFIVPTGVGATEIRYDFSSDEAERAITATR